MINDRIVLSILGKFNKDFLFEADTQEKNFERLVSYIVLAKKDPEAFSDPSTFIDIDADNGGTFGIDTFALLINDTLIRDISDIEVFQKTKKINVQFIFIQSKTSESFDNGDFLKFLKCVGELFRATPTIPLNEDLLNIKNLIDEVFSIENARLFNEKPKVEIFYANTGKKIKDELTLKVIQSEEDRLSNDFNEIKSFKITHIHSDKIIDDYAEIENRQSVNIKIENSLTCDEIDDVEQAYIGYLNSTEFLKLISAKDGSLRKNIFYENVRDFQGNDNSVNNEIDATLKDINLIDKFVLLNNGVTIVARDFKNIRSKDYEISDYYIVNGCQTSNIIHKNRNSAQFNEKLKIPVKIIHTRSNDLITKIIRSTNRQTPVPDEAFWSLEIFHKRLQDYYSAFSQEIGENILYERRSKEFSYENKTIEKPRIVNLHSIIRSFTAIILGEPHLAMSRSPISIGNEQKSRLFLDDHIHITYFTSSLINLKYWQFSTRKKIDKNTNLKKYWIGWIARMFLLQKIDSGNLNSNKNIKTFEAACKNLKNDNYCTTLFTNSEIVFDTAVEYYLKKSKNQKISLSEIVRLKNFRDEIKNSMHDLFSIEKK